ncbi:MAG: shikimate kinase [Pseudomonadota bacterium]
MKKNIILIGMPAVGKSTVGILLAKEIGFGFMDTDILIQTSEGKTLPEIIAGSGVKQFLALEEKYLTDLDLEGHVIATGGSAIYSRKSMETLALNGIIIYLEISLDFLNDRLSSLDSRGVIRAPGQSVESLYFERTPLYNTYADLKIPCGSMPPDQVMSRILEKLNWKS